MKNEEPILEYNPEETVQDKIERPDEPMLEIESQKNPKSHTELGDPKNITSPQKMPMGIAPSKLPETKKDTSVLLNESNNHNFKDSIDNKVDKIREISPTKILNEEESPKQTSMRILNNQANPNFDFPNKPKEFILNNDKENNKESPIHSNRYKPVEDEFDVVTSDHIQIKDSSQKNISNNNKKPPSKKVVVPPLKLPGNNIDLKPYIPHNNSRLLDNKNEIKPKQPKQEKEIKAPRVKSAHSNSEEQINTLFDIYIRKNNINSKRSKQRDRSTKHNSNNYTELDISNADEKKSNSFISNNSTVPKLDLSYLSNIEKSNRRNHSYQNVKPRYKVSAKLTKKLDPVETIKVPGSKESRTQFNKDNSNLLNLKNNKDTIKSDYSYMKVKSQYSSIVTPTASSKGLASPVNSNTLIREKFRVEEDSKRKKYKVALILNSSSKKDLDISIGRRLKDLGINDAINKSPTNRKGRVPTSGREKLFKINNESPGPIYDISNYKSINSNKQGPKLRIPYISPSNFIRDTSPSPLDYNVKREFDLPAKPKIIKQFKDDNDIKKNIKLDWHYDKIVNGNSRGIPIPQQTRPKNLFNVRSISPGPGKYDVSNKYNYSRIKH